MKFCLLTLTGAEHPAEAASFAFFAHHPDDLARAGTCFTLTPEEIMLLNPNTGTCPVFRSWRDAEITLGIYRRHPVLVRKGDQAGNPWGVSFMRMFDMANDAGLFNTRHDLEDDGWKLVGNVFRRGAEVMLPLYEAKMVHQYDHRWATYNPDGTVRDTTEAEHADPGFTVLPRYWVEQSEVDTRLVDRWEQRWFIGVRDVCRSTDERTLISGTVPKSAVSGKFPLLFPAKDAPLMVAMASSFVMDFVARQKIGGTSMSHFILEQLAVLHPDLLKKDCHWSPSRTLRDWIEDRLDELIHTADDIAPAAWALGDDDMPFLWDPERRAVLRAELDGAFFHMYGVERDDVDHILGTFPIVNAKDMKKYGEERTRRLVLDTYDRISAAVRTRVAFASALNPVPGEGTRYPKDPRDRRR